MAAYRRYMTHVTCRLTAKNRDQLRNSTLGNRVWATFTFFTTVCVCARQVVLIIRSQQVTRTCRRRLRVRFTARRRRRSQSGMRRRRRQPLRQPSCAPILPRDAMHARYMLCLSQVGVLLRRINTGSHKQHHTIAQGL